MLLVRRLPRTVLRINPNLLRLTVTARTMSQDKSEAQKDITKWASTDGHFRRQVSSFRDVIEKGGKFEPEKGRYHIFVSYACPWAHRVLITRRLLKLEDIIGLSVVSPRMGSLGWPFAAADEFPGADHDPVQNSNHVRDLYFKADPEYSGRFTVPIVWDKKTSTIVNNESSEIIRFLNSAFRDLAEPVDIDIYPEPLRKEIDDFHSWVYDTVNNGVYKCGFATTQEAYESAVGPLFQSLDRLEKMIDGKEYYIGDRLTEADIRLYTTIVRFDPVYHGHFKTNLGSIRHNYPNINRWMKNLYWNVPAFKETTNFEHPYCARCIQQGTTDRCKYDEVKKSKLTLVKEENADLKERIAQLERQLAGRSPPELASQPLEDVKNPPSSTFSQVLLEEDEDDEHDHGQEEEIDDNAHGDPINIGPGPYQVEPQQQPAHGVRSEHFPTGPVHYSRPQPGGFETRAHHPGPPQLPNDQYQPAYQDPYYSQVPANVFHNGGFTQPDGHARSAFTPHLQTGPLPDVHAYSTWPPTPSDQAPPSASASSFTHSPLTNQWHFPNSEATPRSPDGSYPSINYTRGIMFRGDGRYYGGAMGSYDAYQGAPIQAPVVRRRPAPSPPVYGQDMVMSFFQRWKSQTQPQEYMEEDYAQAQGHTGGSWALVGNWWERDDLSVDNRNQLIELFLPYRKQVGLEIWVPDFLASLHLPPKRRPHPGFMWMIYSFAAFFSGDEELMQLLPEFLERARRNLAESYAKSDRLFDYIRGQTLYSSIMYLQGKVQLGGMAAYSAFHAAIICGLHKISSAVVAPRSQPQEQSGYRLKQVGFQLEPAASPREHGERIAAFWQLLLVDYSAAAITGLPAMFRDDGDERSRVETVFPRPLEEYMSGEANQVSYATLGDIFTSRAIPNPPDIAVTMQVKSMALVERAVRVATKWAHGTHFSSARPNKYTEEYNVVLHAIHHFKSYLPSVYPQEGNATESHLILSSGGLILERLFPHFMIWDAEIQLYSVVEDTDGQNLARESCIRSARDIKTLTLQLTDVEIPQLGVLPWHCFKSAYNVFERGLKRCRESQDEVGAGIFVQELGVMHRAQQLLAANHNLAALQSDQGDTREQDFPVGYPPDITITTL
ncbi:unnamed protein product [Rhizoctonia solani]|uniref:GST C-terminal domain-containing protein n=1 Tax=Rhizoctonia solani TaxID=456999 RepID=A0A8H3B2D3_9AGAM|nr:unnamed protein product [Rhizoctonia solani]